MADTFLALLAAHLIADFPLQPLYLLQHKRNPAVLLLHILVVAVTAAIILGTAFWPVIAVLAGAHLAMDAIKVYALKDTLRSFFIDQGVHLAVIAGLSAVFPNTFALGLWSNLPPDLLASYQSGLCLLSGTILVLQTGGIVVKKATQPFLREIRGEIEGLQHGGAYIGYLERALVMLLVLLNQPAGIGFLITAKSILRFGDMKESHQRKMTEYVIIGTFLSFGWGLLMASITQAALKYWMP